MRSRLIDRCENRLQVSPMELIFNQWAGQQVLFVQRNSITSNGLSFCNSEFEVSLLELEICQMYFLKKKERKKNSDHLMVPENPLCRPSTEDGKHWERRKLTQQLH